MHTGRPRSATSPAQKRARRVQEVAFARARTVCGTQSIVVCVRPHRGSVPADRDDVVSSGDLRPKVPEIHIQLTFSSPFADMCSNNNQKVNLDVPAKLPRHRPTFHNSPFRPTTQRPLEPSPGCSFRTFHRRRTQPAGQNRVCFVLRHACSRLPSSRACKPRAPNVERGGTAQLRDADARAREIALGCALGIGGRTLNLTFTGACTAADL